MPDQPEPIPMPTPERVLCFPAGLLQKDNRYFQGLMTGESALKLLDVILSPENLSWRDRDEAEGNPNHKQICSYAVLFRANKVFRYQRPSSGEQRLAGKLSLGVGGHVNPPDAGNAPPGREAYDAAFLRELAEEVAPRGNWRHRVVGLINDDTTDVGRVHFGVVHEVHLDLAWPDLRPESSMVNPHFEFVTLARRNLDGYEKWSQLVVREILRKIQY